MQLECLINKVHPAGEILDQSFLTSDHSNIGFKNPKIESPVRIFINHLLLNIPYYLRITQSIEKFLCCICNKLWFDFRILDGSCSAASDLSAWKH